MVCEASKPAVAVHLLANYKPQLVPPRQLFGGNSLVSTTIAILLDLNKASVSTAQNLVPAVEGPKEKRFEPLVLKTDRTKGHVCIPLR